MADGPTKRKRGRPNASNASTQSKATAAPPEPEHGSPRDEEEVRPKKRGRPSTDHAAPPADEREVPKRKRRQVGKEQPEEDEPSLTKEKEKKTKKARAPNANKRHSTVEEETNTGRSHQRAGRPALREKPASEAQNKVPATGGVQGKSGRGRRSAAATEATATATADSSLPKQKKKRGRSSQGAEETETQHQQRPTAVDVEEEDTIQPSTSTQRGGNARRESAMAAPLPPKRYLHVAPHVRGVKQATIDAKWTPLAAPSIAVASEILELAHRPIIQRMSGTTRRRQHASAALSVAYRRITRKLQRGLPFPPAGMPSSSSVGTGTGTRGGGDGGRETELDFESVLDGRRALERQLDPALHAVELLRREKAVMVRELEKDYMTLRNLEAGARTQAREQREKLKRSHVLAPEATGRPRLEDVEMVFDDNDDGGGDGLFKDLENGELKDLALQLSGHMDSIKTNLKQTDGLLPQMASTKTALRLVLHQHLNQASAEKAILGA